MYNDDAVSRELPSVEQSIVFFIHAVLTLRDTYQHPSFDWSIGLFRSLKSSIAFAS